MRYYSIILLLIIAPLTDKPLAKTKFVEPPMVRIPAGDYVMGHNSMGGHTKPAHKVTIPSFLAGKYEVTEYEFKHFIDATDYQMPQECMHKFTSELLSREKSTGNWRDNQYSNSEFQPVVCINWNAAKAYTQWLSELSSKNYRLLSEAEWEYLARAGKKERFAFGDDPNQTDICEYENIADISLEQVAKRRFGASLVNYLGHVNCDDHAPFTSIVGMYQPNPFGAYDVQGNVHEYVEDCKNPNYIGAPKDGSAWLTGQCNMRVKRYGSWYWLGRRAARRTFSHVSFSSGFDGFRLALSIGKSKRYRIPKSTKQFEKRLQKEQDQERLRREKLAAAPTAPNNLRLLVSDDKKSVALTWDSVNNDHQITYDVYRTNLPKSRFKRIAQDLKITNFIDYAPSKNHNTYAVTASNFERSSFFSQTKSTPTEPVWAPAIIETEAAFDASSLISMKVGDTGDNLAGMFLAERGWVTFVFNVREEKEFKLTAKVKQLRKQLKVQIKLNDQINRIYQTKISDKEGLSKFSEHTLLEKFTLKPGMHQVRLEPLIGGWILDWIEIAEAN